MSSTDKLSISIQWSGFEAVISALVGRQKAMVREVRNAIRRSATLVLGAMKSRYQANKRTGLLYKSLGKKVTERSNGNVYAVIGARRGFRSEITTGPTASGWAALRITKSGEAMLRKGKALPLISLKRQKAGMLGQVVSPTKYAHLVEKGHGGPHKARAYPFIGPGVSATRAAVTNMIREAMRRAVMGT